MSQETKERLVALLKESGIIPKTSTKDDNSRDVDVNDLTTEEEYVKIYRQLSSKLDELMLREFTDNTITEDEYKEHLKNIGFNDELFSDEEQLLRHLENILDTKRLIIESSIITYPILRAIHNVEGIYEKEANLRNIIKQRDDYASEIIKLNNSISSKQTKLINIENSNREILQTARELTKRLISQKSTSNKSTQDDRLQDKLQIAKQKSFDLCEEINALIVAQGLNWADDSRLRDIVLFCGEIYRD